MCVCVDLVFVCVVGCGCVQHGDVVEIVMQEEKVRQCKVFVVLMQGEDSCWERSDAAAVPAWRQVYGPEMGSTFYSPPPLLLFPKWGEVGGEDYQPPNTPT